MEPKVNDFSSKEPVVTWISCPHCQLYTYYYKWCPIPYKCDHCRWDLTQPDEGQISHLESEGRKVESPNQ